MGRFPASRSAGARTPGRSAHEALPEVVAGRRAANAAEASSDKGRRVVSETQCRKAVFPVAIAAVLVAAALLTAVSRATPSSFELAINGFHSAAEPRDKFSLGFRHEGPFTASAPFCLSGYAVEVLLVPPTAVRRLTCSDGSGSITVRKTVERADALFTHEEGVWLIVDGEGRYATLRGRGVTVSNISSGDPADHITTTYHEVWRGAIDFDATRPAVRISRASATRLGRPKGSYAVRVAFSARDGDGENAISYAMTLSGPGVFVHRSATRSSGEISVTVRVRPKRGAGRLLLVVVVSDPVGNETRVTRQLRLRT
jgi:hypothetical protein